MVRKAIIEQAVSPTSYKVRVPEIDGVKGYVFGTSFDDLPIAYVCAPPNAIPNYLVGDVVYIAYERNEDPVILGKLVTTKEDNTYQDVALHNLSVYGDVNINGVKSSDITNLIDSRTNIQAQIDEINTTIEGGVGTEVIANPTPFGPDYDIISKIRIDGQDYVIEPYAETQSDWTEDDPTSPSYILHKPTISEDITEDGTNLVTSGGIYDALQNNAKNSSVYYVPGEDSVASTTNRSSVWCGDNDEIPAPTLVGRVPHYYAGLTINYKIDVAGNASYGTLLRLNGEDYEHPVVTNVSTHIGTRYAVDCIITLTYDPDYDSSTIGSGQLYYMTCAKNALGTSTTDPTVDGATLAGHTTWVKGDGVLYNGAKYVLVRHQNIGANWVRASSTTSTSVSYFLKGAWKISDYDTNTNTIGYQVRTDSSTRPVSTQCGRYRLLFSSVDNTHWVPATDSNVTNATAQRAVTQVPINPLGDIRYYGYTTVLQPETNVSTAYQWQQIVLNLGYSFNTGVALSLQYPAPVYIKCAPQQDGSAIIDSNLPYVQTLPNEDDGQLYIYLGQAYSATGVELVLNHPVYYYKDGAIRQWTNDYDPAQTNDTIPSAYCTSNSAVANKLADCTDYQIAPNSYLHILFKYGNMMPSAITLNVNGQGAKPVYINGQPSSSTNFNIPAGTYISFYEVAKNYNLLYSYGVGSLCIRNGMYYRCTAPNKGEFSGDTVDASWLEKWALISDSAVYQIRTDGIMPGIFDWYSIQDRPNIPVINAILQQDSDDYTLDILEI